MGTCVVYIDEAGSPHGHHEPLPSDGGETAIFTLAGIAFPLWEWRARDREFLNLKREFYPDRIPHNKKPDPEVEIKGNDLTSPRNAHRARDQEFNRRVLNFILRNSGTGFGVTFLKNPNSPASETSIYTSALQVMVEKISVFISEHPAFDNAILVCDSRIRGINQKDGEVARSHMSFIFGNPEGRQLINIMEPPMFADSRITSGLQIADIFAANLFSNHYYYHCREVEGAPDYSHAQRNWNKLDVMQFSSRQRYQGYFQYGYRVIRHR